MIRKALLLLLAAALPLSAQVESAAPLPAEARGAILDLSLAFGRRGTGGPDLLRFSELSARLSMTIEPVPPAELSAYARAAAALASANGGAREAAAPLKLVYDAIAPRLEPPEREALERAYAGLAQDDGRALLAKAAMTAQALSAEKKDEPLALRPAVEWWSLGEKRYESTAGLVRALQQGPPREEAAFYHFRHEPFIGKTKALAAASGSVIGAGIGAIGAALVVAFFNLAMMPFNFISAAAGGTTTELRLLGPVLLVVGGGIIAGLGTALDSAKGMEREGHWIYGRVAVALEGEVKTVRFFKDRSKDPIDLAQYAGAAPTQTPPAEKKGDDVLIGVGLMILASLAALAPLFIGDIIAGVVAGARHSALSRRLGVPGLDVGAGFLLVILSQSLLFAFASGAAPRLFAGLALLLGGLWGRFVLPRLRAADAAEAAEKGQWWAAPKS